MKIFLFFLIFSINALSAEPAKCSAEDKSNLLKIAMETLNTALINKSAIKGIILGAKQNNKTADYIFDSYVQFTSVFDIDKGMGELSQYVKKHPACADAISLVSKK